MAVQNGHEACLSRNPQATRRMKAAVVHELPFRIATYDYRRRMSNQGFPAPNGFLKKGGML
jgi:hypothetical protein